MRVKDDYAARLTELHSTPLVVEEVANALLKAMKLGRITLADAQLALEALSDLAIKLHEVSWSRAAKVLSMASELGLNCYDASYAGLAGETRSTLITADDTLYQKASKQCSIIHIKDYR